MTLGSIDQRLLRIERIVLPEPEEPGQGEPTSRTFSAGASPEAALGAAQELADDSQPGDEPISANPPTRATGAGVRVKLGAQSPRPRGR